MGRMVGEHKKAAGTQITTGYNQAVQRSTSCFPFQQYLIRQDCALFNAQVKSGSLHRKKCQVPLPQKNSFGYSPYCISSFYYSFLIFGGRIRWVNGVSNKEQTSHTFAHVSFTGKENHSPGRKLVYIRVMSGSAQTVKWQKMTVRQTKPPFFFLIFFFILKFKQIF